MAKISAFVGHSFLPEDQEVVRKFTDLFNDMEKSHDFEWVHATEPRPQLVDAKVLELMEGRNLLIGICTPNERVAKESRFKETLFGDQIKIKKEHLEWKTSDWIIQEIGLAIGRNMNIIILLQNGVRQPGSLQGNIEYIPFDRNNVEMSFRQILGMITGLQNSGATGKRSDDAPVSGKSSDDDHDDDVVDNEPENPDESWDEMRFEFEYFKAVILRNVDRAESISAAWKQRLGSDQEAAAAWDAFCLLQATKYSDENNLSELTSLADRYPSNSSIQLSLARAHRFFEDHERARDRYQVALRDMPDVTEKRNTLAELAQVYQSLGDSNGMTSTVAKMRDMVNSIEDEKQLLSQLESLDSWYSGNKMLKLALMEREVEISPADTHKRFQLAYAYSENSNNRLTLFHYEKIPESQRDPMTWNNMGVAYQGFSLSGLAVSAYQTSANEGQTLAMSNLAERLMSAGFLDEAQRELHRAKDASDVHKSVAKSQVRLDSIRPEEQEKRREKLEGAPEFSKFLAEVGRQLWQPLPSSVGSTWSNDEVSLNVEITDGKITAKGTLERKKSANGLIAAALQSKDENSVEVHDVTLTGRLIGSVLVGVYAIQRRKNPLETLSLFDIYPKEEDCIAVLEAEDGRLRCLIGTSFKEFKVLA